MNLETKPCPICGGVGFLRRDVPVDDPDFGRAIPCECKQRETAQAALSHLRVVSGVSGDLAYKTFANFRTSLPGLNEQHARVLANALRVAQQIAQTGKGWLVLIGGTGVGKTHLAAAIYNDRIARGLPALFVVIPDLLDHLRAAFSPESDTTYDERFETVRESPFLILDDLGAHNATSWAEEKLYQLINFRHTAQLPMVVTTNLPLEEFEPRMRSRLNDMELSTQVVLSVQDYRDGASGSGFSGMEAYSGMTLDTFVTKREGLTRDQNESLRNALNHAREFADTWTGMLTFTGLHGSGKTHLAAAIGHKAASLSGAVRFFTVSDFLDQLRATFQPGRLSYSKIFEDAKRAGVLILDDLGAQKESDWATEKLRQIIDYRWLNQLPTVVTTLDTIDMDAGIRDRLFDRRIGQVVSLEGIPSFRMSEEASRMVDARSKKGKPGKHKL